MSRTPKANPVRFESISVLRPPVFRSRKDPSANKRLRRMILLALLLGMVWLICREGSAKWIEGRWRALKTGIAERREASMACCSACQGNGVVVCNRCGGAKFAQNRRDAACPACNGRGALNRRLSKHAAPCVKCGGTGRLLEQAQTTCMACDGRGMVTCPRCAGRGKVRPEQGWNIWFYLAWVTDKISGESGRVE